MTEPRHHSDVLIVGSGHAGAQCAIALRQAGFAGTLTIVGGDPELPYERPPLSKDYLAGEKPFERLLVRPADFWVARDIVLRPGTLVSDVQPASKVTKFASGEAHSYGQLVWATGGMARRLSCEGANCAGMHTIRDRADTDALIADLDAGARKVVVIGGGYIGLEAAAVLRTRGCEVTVIEMAERLLARVAGPELAEFYAAEHRVRGVDIRLGETVAALESGADGRVCAAVLDSGERLQADIVIAGIGIVPSVGPLLSAGATGSNGVDVDDYCRTSLPDIYAIGDCASHGSVWADGAVIRVESVQNAHDMAKCVAQAIMGDPQPYEAFPWFWSNQYDLRLQTAGLFMGADDTVLRGDMAARKFSVIYRKAGRVIAVDSVNSAKDFVQGRKLIEARATPSAAELADPDIPLKDLL